MKNRELKEKIKTNSIAAFKYQTTNIGDDIQTVAGLSRFASLNINFIDRDSYWLHWSPEPLWLIANGWYTHHITMTNHGVVEPSECKSYYNFPPITSSINPIFLGVHLATGNALTTQAKILLKEHCDLNNCLIGARDHWTMKFLADALVPSFFSGCPTLGLGKYFEHGNLPREELIVFNDIPPGCSEIALSKFPDLHPVYTTQYSKSKGSQRDAIERAECYIKLFARSKLVITSRLHTALPCVALGTPVIFVHSILNHKRYKDYLHLFGHFCHFNSFEPPDYNQLLDKAALSKSRACNISELQQELISRRFLALPYDRSILDELEALLSKS